MGHKKTETSLQKSKIKSGNGKMHFVTAKSILTGSNGLNIYRGCTHGCIYCDSRSDCYHNPKPFEDIEIKQNAVELLECALKRKRTKCMIGTGAMSDPYMPVEKDLNLTRQCLQVISKHGFGATVLTKSDLVLRDLNLFKEINNKSKAVLQMTLTTFDDTLCQKIEPNVCPTSRRVQVLKEFEKEGIPCIVWLCPFLPGINNTIENLAGLLDYCRQVNVKGILNFGIGLTLRSGNREYFYKQLDKSFPGKKQQFQKIFGNSYIVNSSNSNELMEYFTNFCKANKILYTPQQCFSYLNHYPARPSQLQFKF